MSLRKISNIFTKPITFYKTKYSIIENKINNIQLPEKYKGTFLEKWVNYWKFFLKDYTEAVIGVKNEFRDKPVKSWFYVSGIVLTTYLAKNNPDEISFQEDLRNYSNEVLLVSPGCQNPTTVQHLTFLERCYNEGVLRRISIGICSFIWIDDYDKACSIYKATCEYLEPEYITFTNRIIDIGILNKWWNLQSKIIDYDVNY